MEMMGIVASFPGVVVMQAMLAVMRFLGVAPAGCREQTLDRCACNLKPLSSPTPTLDFWSVPAG